MSEKQGLSETFFECIDWGGQGLSETVLDNLFQKTVSDKPYPPKHKLSNGFR